MDELSHDFVPAIVIDNGSGVMKGGFAGEDRPRVYMPTVATYSRKRTTSNTTESQLQGISVLMGRDALDQPMDNNSVDSLEYPMKRGIVENFDIMESLWDRMFQKLQSGDGSVDMPGAFSFLTSTY